MTVNEFLHKTRQHGMPDSFPRPWAECKDGFVMSVQAGKYWYSLPGTNDAAEYKAVEVGYPTMEEDLLIPYAENPGKPRDTVYGFVPVDIVDKVLEKHGGIVKIGGMEVEKCRCGI